MIFPILLVDRVLRETVTDPMRQQTQLREMLPNLVSLHRQLVTSLAAREIPPVNTVRPLRQEDLRAPVHHLL